MRSVACAALGLAMAASIAHGQATTQPFIRHTFEENQGGWQVLGAGGKVSRTQESADVKEGQSALAFEYKVEKGSMAALVVPFQPGDLAKARAFRFWVKADYAAPLAVALQEKEGGRYLAMFTAPAGKWQQVELSSADFYLSDDGSDPKDPNNKLDLNEVENAGIVDVAQMFAQADPAFGELLGIKLGAHRLLLDDFSVSAEPLTAAVTTSDKEIGIESMVRPQISWFGVGRLTLSQAAKEPLAGKSLQVDYHGAPGKAAGFVKRIPRGRLAGMDKISFTCASVKPAKLMVQLEERGGGKYNVMI
ncbi:MAG: hypothetical protein HY248_02785, partial [Fimbriimonas ginsengisoli]|nr:hypothetical protein [Fimbriimonas ginsengisoli]